MKNIDEFVAFLEENNIKELYKKALIENGVINYLHFLEDSKPRNFICGAFSWSNTPEGYKFWQDVDLKWVTLLKELETPIKVGDKYILAYKNGVRSITIDGGDANRNYSYEVTLTDDGMTVKPSILPKWHGSPISAEESDEPKEGDKCIFWSDGEAIIAIDTFTLKRGENNNVAYIDGRHFCWRVGNNYFSHCVKYSDDKLIEIVNRLWQK